MFLCNQLSIPYLQTVYKDCQWETVLQEKSFSGDFQYSSAPQQSLQSNQASSMIRRPFENKWINIAPGTTKQRLKAMLQMQNGFQLLFASSFNSSKLVKPPLSAMCVWKTSHWKIMLACIVQLAMNNHFRRSNCEDLPIVSHTNSGFAFCYYSNSSYKQHVSCGLLH